ncbi:MAG: site-2 protease family protein [Acidimicrobiia bacterium]
MGDVDWARVALLVAVVVPSVILHEVAHGAAANLFGDDTARRAGRLTLNPLRHVDPFGTFVLPLLLSLSGVGAFGYAKPVPVNLARLRDPRRHALFVSLAGPATNIALLVVATVLLRSVFAGDLDRAFSIDDLSLAARFTFWFGFVNVLLAVFNLLPIPPLDGSALVERAMPASWWPAWHRFRPYGMGLILLVVVAAPGVLTKVFDPALRFWFRSL